MFPRLSGWDFPVVKLGRGGKCRRRYTDFYGASGRSSWAIARDGLLHGSEWSNSIDAWQKPYVQDESKPAWYRGILFNEPYTLTDCETFSGRHVNATRNDPPTFPPLAD